MAPISTLTVRLTAQIAEFQSEFRTATKEAKKFADGFEGIATRAAAVGTFIGNIATKIASSLASAFGQGLRDAIRLSSEFSNAFIGLSSVARAFGADADRATAAARQLSSDGLLPLKDSATGLKNLLAAGFNLDQSVKLMNAFKDSAAFGRQGALSFGDAVRSATEGVKNGNSILVDNAGVTKNLSQILKEAGFSAQDLSRASSDAGVRMALFNGILKETVAQTGDAQKLTQTYSGQVSRLNAAYDSLLVTIGSSITQNATVARTIGAISDAIFGLNQQLVTSRNAFVLVSDSVIFLVRSFAGILNAVDIVQTGFRGLQVVSNGLFEAIANIGIAIFKFTEKALTLQKFLDPVNFTRHAAGAREAREAYVFLEGAADGLRKASQDATNASISFGNKLQTVRAEAINLAKELDTTRGKTVELGVVAGTAGAALSNGLAEGSKKAQAALKKLQASIDRVASTLKFGLPKTLPGLKVDLSKLLDFSTIFTIPDISDRIRTGFEKQLEGPLSRLPGIQVPIELIAPPAPPLTFFQKILGDLGNFGQQLSGVIVGALQGGGSVVKSAASFIGQTITTNIAKTITSGAGWAIKGALGGVINGLLPGVGALLGPLVDKIAGLFRNTQHERANDIRDEFLSQFGPGGTGSGSGFAQLAQQLHEVGSAGDAMFQRLLRADDVEELNGVIADINRTLDEFGTEAERAQKRLDALGRAVEGVNKRAELFAAPFQKLTDAIKEADGSELDALKRKLQATAQAGQAEFERLGQFVGATFAGLVQETGNGLDALNRLAPAIAVLQRGVKEFGLESTATIDRLIGLSAFVNDEVFGPILQTIQATGQIFEGLQSAGFLTADLFQAVATDIGAAFKELEAKGGDVAAAMALSQPVLQRLWEAQQSYGQITDETTRKLLDQAEQQGIVGAHMRDVNRQILDVLIAIADVFGAVLPESIRATSQAAADAAKNIEREFNSIRIDPIKVDVQFNDPELPNIKIPALASGGLVRRPTLALVGEAGPEAVVPLNRLDSVTTGPEPGDVTTIVQIDGRTVAHATVQHLPGAARKYVRA